MFVLFLPEIKRRIAGDEHKRKIPTQFHEGMTLMELSSIWCQQDLERDCTLPLEINDFMESSDQGDVTDGENNRDTFDGGAGVDNLLENMGDIMMDMEGQLEIQAPLAPDEDGSQREKIEDKKPSEIKVKRKSREWNEPDIRKFVDQYFYPNQDIFRKLNTLDTIVELLDLYEQYGGCPSVVSSEYDQEFKTIKNEYDNFKKITLREHVLNVTRQMIALVQNADEEIGVQLGKFIIVGLGHDVGKIPELRDNGKGYMMADHPVISASVVRSIMPPDLPGAGEVLDAIRNHHQRKTNDKLTEFLRVADQNAREMEARSISKEATRGYSMILEEAERLIDDDSAESKKPQGLDLSWLNYDKLMNRLKEHINAVDVVKPSAFSMPDGTVYIMPVLITKAIIDFAIEDGGHEELLQIAQNTKGKRDIEYSVVNVWRARELIPDYVGESYNGGKFDLLDEKGKRIEKGYYTPIKYEAFVKNLADLEQRKKGMEHLPRIKKVSRTFGR
jgi:hypothetical protein